MDFNLDAAEHYSTNKMDTTILPSYAQSRQLMSRQQKSR